LSITDTHERYRGCSELLVSTSGVDVLNSLARVSFGYKDYWDNKNRIMTLEGTEFIRRFLLHVLPEGLVRIRHYGFPYNRTYQEKRDTLRACLQIAPPVTQNGDVR